MTHTTKEIPFCTVKQGPHRKKSYAVTMVYTVLAESDNEAISIANINKELMDRNLDNRPEVLYIHKKKGLETVTVYGDTEPEVIEDVPFDIVNR
jgi:hypothetical protein